MRRSLPSLDSTDGFLDGSDQLDIGSAVPSSTESNSDPSLPCIAVPNCGANLRETLREKNRLAQRRCRDKAKAQLQEVEQRVLDTATSLSRARSSLATKREQRHAIRQRIKDLKQECRDHLHQLLRSNWAAAPQARPRNWQGLAIFRESRLEGRPLPHEVAVSSAALSSDEGPLLTRLRAFQSREARRLGCGVSDVAWRYECTALSPDITRDAPIPSNLHPSGCKARAALVCLAARVECALLLAAWTRVNEAAAPPPPPPPPPLWSVSLSPFHLATAEPSKETLSASPPALHSSDLSDVTAAALAPFGSQRHGSTDSFLTAAFPPVAAHTRGARPGAARRSTSAATAADAGSAAPAFDAACPAVDLEDELSDRVYAFLLDDPTAAQLTQPGGHPPPRSHGAAPTEASQRRERPGALASFAALVRRVMDALFAEYVPLASAPAVELLAKRLASALPASLASERVADGGAPLTSRSGAAALLCESAAAAKRAASAACASRETPELPAAESEAGRREEELEARMGASFEDWALLCVLVMQACPVWACRAASGFNPSSAGPAQARQRNLAAYEQLALSIEQKRAVAAARQRYLASRAELDDDAAALASNLAGLPTAEDMTAHDALAASASARPAHVKSRDPSLVASWWRSRAAEELGKFSARRAQQSATVWTQRLLGADPGETEAAAVVLDGLRRTLTARHEAYVEFFCAFADLLTPRQRAWWFSAQLPFVADAWRIAAMAAADLERDRVYGGGGAASDPLS